MRRVLGTAWAAALLALASGCASGPILDNPLLVGPSLPGPVEQNPVYVPGNPERYGLVFECAFQTLADLGFDILDSNRFTGQIETLPKIAPGLVLFAKPGSPDLYERFLSSLQTYRHRARIVIQPANNGGFFIQVTVLKELEDLPRPVRSTAGAAVFQNLNSVERQFEVIDPTYFEAAWIPKGRDSAFEQAILQRLKRCL
jgi:hypothetical protein